MADSLANLAIDTATSSQVIHPSARCGHAGLHAHFSNDIRPGWLHSSDVAPLIPLGDPTHGFRDNCATSMVLLFVTSFLTVAGTMSQVRAAAAIPLALHTNIDMVLVGIASSVPFMGLATLVAIYWRYPIPFATALLIGIDVLQGLYAVRKFMLRGSAFSRTEVVATLARL